MKRTAIAVIASALLVFTGGAVAQTETVVSSSYLGGTSNDVANGIDVAANCAYIVGTTTSLNFPTTSSYQATLTRYGDEDIFVTKTSSTGSTILYSTYLGGTGTDQGFGIRVDSTGAAYVVGRTESSNFPTISAYQTSRAGNYDGVILKLTTTGSALTYSTYYGGADDDIALALEIDAAFAAYVTGSTLSINFPTSSSYQDALAGQADAFVAKITSTGSDVTYSTYIGGAQMDSAVGIDVDSSLIAYIAGSTMSTDFPTLSSFQSTKSTSGYEFDGFVTKINSAGDDVTYSTYLGGSSSDGARGIAVGSDNTAYVTGYTASADFPTSAVGAYQIAHAGGTFDAFFTKFSDTGAAIMFSTYLGGAGMDIARGVDIDSKMNGFVTGRTASEDFPTAYSYQDALAGEADAFFTKFTAAGTALDYSSYFGGTYWDESMGIHIDADDDVYLTGKTESADFPTTASYQSTISNAVNQRWDGFYIILE